MISNYLMITHKYSSRRSGNSSVYVYNILALRFSIYSLCIDTSIEIDKKNIVKSYEDHIIIDLCNVYNPIAHGLV